MSEEQVRALVEEKIKPEVERIVERENGRMSLQQIADVVFADPRHCNPRYPRGVGMFE